MTKRSRPKNVVVFMKETVTLGHVDHIFSPLINIIAFIIPFWIYAYDIKHLISLLLISKTKIQKLRIHSHGNKNPPNLRKPVNGPLIRMGSDNITEEDFSSTGVPKSECVKDFIKTLSIIMNNDSQITFDACNQGRGDILRNISKALGPNIMVNGFSHL